MRENEAYLRHKAMAAQQAKEEEQRWVTMLRAHLNCLHCTAADVSP